MEDKTGTTALWSRDRVRTSPPNHRGRYSTSLSEGKAIDLIEAAAHALKIGRPLNRFITIHLEKGGVDSLLPQGAIGQYLRLAGQWLGDKGVPSTYLWVLERGAGTGLHAHILLHCPSELSKEFGFRARSRWLSLSGIEPRKGVIKSERVGPRGFATHSATKHQRQSYFDQLRGVLRYINKALDHEAKSALARHLPPAARPSLAELLGIETAYCSPIYGRRCSRSQNISVKARAQYASQQPEPGQAEDP